MMPALAALPGPRENLAGFMRLLRENGFAIGLAETIDAAKITLLPLASRPELFKQALKTLCCAHDRDWLRFDALFDAHFLGKGVKSRLRSSGTMQGARPNLQSLARQAQQDGGAGRAGAEAIESGGQAGHVGEMPQNREASAAEALSRRDLAKIADPEELARAKALAARLAQAMQARLTRRQRADAGGAWLDLRRSLHRSIAFGGEPLALAWRRRKPKPLKLVILLDASGSMALYAPFFLRFMHGALEAFAQSEAFVFHTRLVHVAEAFRDRDMARALDRLSLMAEGIGGGTRIGESLATFNRWHGARVLHSRCCVLIFSDGCDTGPPGQLAEEMARLRRRCRRIVWLNPLLGQPGYQPLVRGMQEALPFLDLFAPAHNLASLAALEPYLAKI